MPSSWNVFTTETKTKRVLSSQALNVDRSLGVSSNMKKFTLDSDAQGPHTCTSAIGKMLHTEQELEICCGGGQKQWNSGPFSAHVPANFVVFHHTWQKNILWKWVAIDVTANSKAYERRFLIGWCSVVQAKWKSIVWKNSRRARFVNKHTMQTAPLGANTHEKSMNNSNKFSNHFGSSLFLLKKELTIPICNL